MTGPHSAEHPVTGPHLLGRSVTGPRRPGRPTPAHLTFRSVR